MKYSTQLRIANTCALFVSTVACSTPPVKSERQRTENKVVSVEHVKSGSYSPQGTADPAAMSAPTSRNLGRPGEPVRLASRPVSTPSPARQVAPSAEPHDRPGVAPALQDPDDDSRLSYGRHFPGTSITRLGPLGPTQALVSSTKGSDDDAPSSQQTSAIDEEAQIAEALANPLSYLWLLFAQNDTVWYDGEVLDALGEDPVVMNTTLIQPVLSLQLTEEWKAVMRPVIPLNSFKTVGNVNVSSGTPGQPIGVDLERETGLGDIVLWTAFSNQYTPPFIWGFGPTVMLPTATDDRLGSGKYSAGPMALAFNVTEKWIVGVVAQHWWSFAGDDDLSIKTSRGPARVARPDVSLTDVQPVIRYRVTNKTNIGMAPNWRYDWEQGQASIPVGLGGDTLVKFGRLPVKVGFEAYHYVKQDDAFGPDWQFRLIFVPVVPAPDWSRTPLF